nr:hypothetical protein [Tanacetum cinerariifolium]
MVNVIPPDHVDDVPVVEPNQHDDVPVVLEHVLVDEDEDPEEDEFEEEEEDPQEEEDDMEVDIKEDENEPELTYPYKEVDPLNPLPPVYELEPEDAIEVKSPIEHEDETVPASVHEVGESSTAPFLREDSDGLLPGLMRRGINSFFGRMAVWLRDGACIGREERKSKGKYYGKLILDLGNEVHFSVEKGMAAMEKLVEKLGNAEDKVECKKLKKELEESSFSNTFLRMKNERVKRDLYWTRVRAHESYQEFIHRGFVFEEIPNEAIDVPIEYENNFVLLVVTICIISWNNTTIIIPPKSAPLTQAAICRLIKDNAGATIDAKLAIHANVGNDARGFEPDRGQDAAPAARECTFSGFIKCNPTAFHGTKGSVELLRWFEKTESVFGISDCAEGKKVRFAAAMFQGPALSWWNAKIATICLETVNQMPWTERKQLMTTEFNELALMCPRMVEPERVKVDPYIRGLTDNIKGEVTSSKPANLNEAVRMAHKLMDQKSQAKDEGILEGKKRKYESFQSGNSSSANALPILTCYDCGEQCHTRNRCPWKVKQEEVGEVRGRSYSIKDAVKGFECGYLYVYA